MSTSPVRSFVRIDGRLTQIEPLTKPHREQSAVTARVVRDGSIVHVEVRDIIHDY